MSIETQIKLNEHRQPKDTDTAADADADTVTITATDRDGGGGGGKLKSRKPEGKRSGKAGKLATTTISQRTKTRVTRIILAVCQIYTKKISTTQMHREKIGNK